MWQHVKLSRSVPEIHSHVVGTLSNQATNKQTSQYPRWDRSVLCRFLYLKIRGCFGLRGFDVVVLCCVVVDTLFCFCTFIVSLVYFLISPSPLWSSAKTLTQRAGLLPRLLGGDIPSPPPPPPPTCPRRHPRPSGAVVRG